MHLFFAMLLAATPAAPPKELVDLTTIPGLSFEIGYATALNFTGAPLPGYEVPGAWLRKEAAASLKQVLSTLLPQSMGLVVYDAYRPVRASKAMVLWSKASGHEDWLQQGYIAEYSRHNLGVAIDLSLTLNGQPVDMGGEWDHFGPESTFSAAKGTAMENRRHLREAMQAAGWIPYDKEWWHFSFPLPDVPALDIPYGTVDITTSEPPSL